MGAEGGTKGWKLSGLSGEQYTALLVAYAQEIAKDPYVLGAVVFSSGCPDDWAEYSIDEITPQLIKQLSYGGTVANVGAGLMKADPHIGPIAEDEIIDQKGTPSEVRRVSTPKGWATYDPKSNETVVFVSATGELLADGGNHWQGTLRQVRPPFR